MFSSAHLTRSEVLKDKWTKTLFSPNMGWGKAPAFFLQRVGLYMVLAVETSSVATDTFWPACFFFFFFLSFFTALLLKHLSLGTGSAFCLCSFVSFLCKSILLPLVFEAPLVQSRSALDAPRLEAGSLLLSKLSMEPSLCARRQQVSPALGT